MNCWSCVHESKCVACPDTRCSTLPAHSLLVCGAAERNCTTNAQLLGRVGSLWFISSPPFLGSVSVTFPLPRVGEKHRETNGKSTQANGKDFGKEKPQTVKSADANGFCGHNRNPPIEEAIKKFCNQFGW